MSLNEIYHPMQLTNWLLVEVALLLIGLTKISVTKFGFNHTTLIESPLRLSSQHGQKKLPAYSKLLLSLISVFNR